MEQSRTRGLSGGTLKLIALITMIVDHVTYVFADHIYNPDLYWLGRGIGRLAFPIYCFLIVEGFFHTRSVKKYCFRLFLFALISEVPFDLALTGMVYNPRHQNVFFTLLIGVAVMYLLQMTRKATEEKQAPWKRYLLLLGYIAAFVAAFYIRADYGCTGVALIVLMYLFHGSRGSVAIVNIMINALLAQGSPIQYAGACSVIPIWLYNGKKGLSLKYFFYIIYPLHLLILYWIKNFVM